MTPHISHGLDCTINPIVIDDSKRSAPNRKSFFAKYKAEIKLFAGDGRDSTCRRSIEQASLSENAAFLKKSISPFDMRK